MPVVIGAEGVERIVEIEMADSEKQQLSDSVKRVSELVAKL